MAHDCAFTSFFFLFLNVVIIESIVIVIQTSHLHDQNLMKLTEKWCKANASVSRDVPPLYFLTPSNVLSSFFWGCGCCFWLQGKPAKIAEEAGGAVTAFGSYKLGVNDQCASINSHACTRITRKSQTRYNLIKHTHNKYFTNFLSKKKNVQREREGGRRKRRRGVYTAISSMLVC